MKFQYAGYLLANSSNIFILLFRLCWCCHQQGFHKRNHYSYNRIRWSQDQRRHRSNLYLLYMKYNLALGEVFGRSGDNLKILLLSAFVGVVTNKDFINEIIIHIIEFVGYKTNEGIDQICIFYT